MNHKALTKLLALSIAFCTILTHCMEQKDFEKLSMPRPTEWEHENVGYDILFNREWNCCYAPGKEWSQYQKPDNILMHVQTTNYIKNSPQELDLIIFIEDILQKYEDTLYALIYRHLEITPQDFYGVESSPEIRQEIIHTLNNSDPIFKITLNGITILNTALELLEKSPL